jgi:hypothetical protein
MLKMRPGIRAGAPTEVGQQLARQADSANPRRGQRKAQFPSRSVAVTAPDLTSSSAAVIHVNASVRAAGRARRFVMAGEGGAEVTPRKELERDQPELSRGGNWQAGRSSGKRYTQPLAADSLRTQSMYALARYTML